MPTSRLLRSPSMRRILSLAIAVPFLLSATFAADKDTSDPGRLARIKAAKMPKITQPVMFDTKEADEICSALEVFPPDNPWNQTVTDWPVHPRSKEIVATVGADKVFRANRDMAFIIV